VLGSCSQTLHSVTSFQPPAAFLRVVAIVEVNAPVSAGDEFSLWWCCSPVTSPHVPSSTACWGTLLARAENPTQRLRTLTTAMPAGAASYLEAWSWLVRAFPSLGPGETLGSVLLVRAFPSMASPPPWRRYFGCEGRPNEAFGDGFGGLSLVMRRWWWLPLKMKVSGALCKSSSAPPSRQLPQAWSEPAICSQTLGA
jgi:hypothetical protein